MDQLLIQRIINAAGAIDLDLPDIPFTVGTSEPEDSNGQPQLRISLYLYPSAIGFKSVNDCYACSVRIVVFQADAKGKIIGSDWRMLEELLPVEAFDRARESGLSFSITIPLKAQTKVLKVIVYDQQNDKFGSKLIQFSSSR